MVVYIIKKIWDPPINWNNNLKQWIGVDKGRKNREIKDEEQRECLDIERSKETIRKQHLIGSFIVNRRK